MQIFNIRFFTAKFPGEHKFYYKTEIIGALSAGLGKIPRLSVKKKK